MRIVMKKTINGSPDGHTIVQYIAGQLYDLGGTPRSDDLLQVFLRKAWAAPYEARQKLEDEDDVVVEVKAQPEFQSKAKKGK